jgi:hypothetical protein
MSFQSQAFQEFSLTGLSETIQSEQSQHAGRLEGAFYLLFHWPEPRRLNADKRSRGVVAEVDENGSRADVS